MKRSTEFKVSPNRAIMLVGDPGTRKTSLMLHFPKPFIFDADSNLTGPVSYYGDDLPFLYESAYVVSRDVKIHNKQYQEGDTIEPQHRYWWMISCLNDAATSDEVETIGLDSLTALVDILIAEVKRQQGRKQEDDMRLQDWGKFAFLFKHLVTQLKTWPKITVATCHNLIDKDEVDNRYKTFLSIPGQTKNTISALFNDVWGFYIKQSGPPNNRQYEYRVRTMPAGETDHRGIKPSMSQLAKTMPWDELAKFVKGFGTKDEDGTTASETNTNP